MVKFSNLLSILYNLFNVNEKLLKLVAGRSERLGHNLTHEERLLLSCAFGEIQYIDVAEEMNYGSQYARAQGSKFWAYLSRLFDAPKPLTKKTVRIFLEEELKKNSTDIGNPPEVEAYIPRPQVESEILGLLLTKRLLVIYGWSGGGKSITLARVLSSHQPYVSVVWQSMEDMPTLEDCLNSLAISLGVKGEGRITYDLIFDCLNQRRALLVLDPVEGSESPWDTFLSKSLRHLTNGGIAVLCRELPKEIEELSLRDSGCGIYKMPKFDRNESVELLKNQGLVDNDGLIGLSQAADFNPLILLEKARIIRDLFNSDASEYLEYHPSASSPLLARIISKDLQKSRLTANEIKVLRILNESLDRGDSNIFYVQNLMSKLAGQGIRYGEGLEILQSLKSKDILVFVGQEIEMRCSALKEIVKQLSAHG